VEGLGFVTAGLNLGLAAGTALAGLVADAAGGRWVFVAGAGLGAAGFLAAIAAGVRASRHRSGCTLSR
jgi:predicted MFS family arabinose efflux permease